MPNEIGIDKIKAVNADNCCGERFFVLNITTKVGKERNQK